MAFIIFAGDKDNKDNKMHVYMNRKITILTLFLWLMTVTFPVIAQQKADTTYTFRFVQQKDMGYVPWIGNDTELACLLECIENNRATILDGKLPLLVDGYCNSQSSEAENIATAKIRANRVKSEQITRAEISLRANLLRWATLTPDLGVEWRICPSWGIAVNSSWTSWSWSDKDRRYALWEVAPEVRYYMGEKKAWYLGAMFKTGQFNYKLSETGKQGDLMGGGITAGYQLRLNKALALDFNLGLGYLNADFEKYEVIDGVRVRCGNETKNWCGPINAGVTLVWKLF